MRYYFKKNIEIPEETNWTIKDFKSGYLTSCVEVAFTISLIFIWKKKKSKSFLVVK